jgi:hypothetical protein
MPDAARRFAFPTLIPPSWPTEEVVQLDITLTMKPPLADRLTAYAEKAGRRPVDIVADLIEVALADDLLGAILDEGA